MKALFYWPDCTRQFVLSEGMPGCLNEQGPPRTVFWVGALRQEVEEHLAERMVNFNIAFRRILQDPVAVDEEYTFDGQFYFIVPSFKRLTDPAVPWRRIFPYSGMWGQHRPWLPIGPPSPELPYEPKGVELQSLDDLERLERDIRNYGYISFKVPEP